MFIRSFAPGDTAAIRHLNAEALAGTGAIPTRPGWDADLDEIGPHYIAHGNGDFLVGLIDGGLVAMGGVLVDGADLCEIKRLRVTPALQGRGLARALLTALEARARNLGAKAIFADTTVQQVSAQKLYLTMGYQLGERYEADGFSVLRFAKDIKL